MTEPMSEARNVKTNSDVHARSYSVDDTNHLEEARRSTPSNVLEAKRGDYREERNCTRGRTS